MSWSGNLNSCLEWNTWSDHHLLITDRCMPKFQVIYSTTRRAWDGLCNLQVAVMERLDDDFMQLWTKDLVLSWCGCCSSLGAAAAAAGDIMTGAHPFRSVAGKCLKDPAYHVRSWPALLVHLESWCAVDQFSDDFLIRVKGFFFFGFFSWSVCNMDCIPYNLQQGKVIKQVLIFSATLHAELAECGRSSCWVRKEAKVQQAVSWNRTQY